MTKALEIYHDIMTNYEKHLLLVFQELSGKMRPFSTKNVTHLRKPVSTKEGIAVTYVTLQHMKQLKTRCFNSDSKGYLITVYNACL